MSTGKTLAPEKRRGRPPRETVPGSLGARIRKARLDVGLTTKQLAQRIGVSDVAITYIETGQTNPARRTLVLLAQELGTDFKVPGLRSQVKPQPQAVRVEGRVAAGEPIDEILEGEKVSVDPDLIKLTGDVCALQVRGDSMIADHVLDSDILICRRASPDDVPPNAIAVVELADIGATVKRWRRKGQSVTLGDETYTIKQIRRVFEVAGLIRRATKAQGESVSSLTDELLRCFYQLPADRQKALVDVALEFVEREHPPTKTGERRERTA